MDNDMDSDLEEEEEWQVDEERDDALEHVGERGDALEWDGEQDDGERPARRRRLVGEPSGAEVTEPQSTPRPVLGGELGDRPAELTKPEDQLTLQPVLSKLMGLEPDQPFSTPRWPRSVECLGAGASQTSRTPCHPPKTACTSSSWIGWTPRSRAPLPTTACGLRTGASTRSAAREVVRAVAAVAARLVERGSGRAETATALPRQPAAQSRCGCTRRAPCAAARRSALYF